MSGVNNNVQVGNNITPTVNTPNTQVGTPDPNAVNAMQNHLNGTDQTAITAKNTPVAAGSGISSADMKAFMDEVTKFCVQQGISTTPSATRD